AEVLLLVAVRHEAAPDLAVAVAAVRRVHVGAVVLDGDRGRTHVLGDDRLLVVAAQRQRDPLRARRGSRDERQDGREAEERPVVDRGSEPTGCGTETIHGTPVRSGGMTRSLSQAGPGHMPRNGRPPTPLAPAGGPPSPCAWTNRAGL